MFLYSPPSLGDNEDIWFVTSGEQVLRRSATKVSRSHGCWQTDDHTSPCPIRNYWPPAWTGSGWETMVHVDELKSKQEISSSPNTSLLAFGRTTRPTALRPAVISETPKSCCPQHLQLYLKAASWDFCQARIQTALQVKCLLALSLRV